MSETEATARPWRYRPLKYDDWGVIRSVNGNFIAQTRPYRADDDLDAHRRNGTDPWRDTAEEIVRAVNNHDALLAALKSVEEALTGITSQAEMLELPKMAKQAECAAQEARAAILAAGGK